MNRRSFFKLMGLGSAATMIATSLPSLLAPKTTAYCTYIMGEDAITFHNGPAPKPLTLADIRKCVEQLKSRSVKPVEGQFAGWVHPNRVEEVNQWIRYKWNYQWTAGRS